MKVGFNRILNKLRVGTSYNYKNKQSFVYRNQLSKIFICILIVLVIIALKKIDLKFTNNVIRIVEDTLDYSIDIKEDTMKIVNFVKDNVKFPNEVISVFKKGISLKSDMSIHISAL